MASTKTFASKLGPLLVLIFFLTLIVEDYAAARERPGQIRPIASTCTSRLTQIECEEVLAKLKITPKCVDVTLTPGSIKKVLDLESTGAQGFVLYGNPTSVVHGINWSPSSGGISPTTPTNGPTPISIQVADSIEPGVYVGQGTLINFEIDKGVGFPVRVTVVSQLSDAPSGGVKDNFCDSSLPKGRQRNR